MNTQYSNNGHPDDDDDDDDDCERESFSSSEAFSLFPPQSLFTIEWQKNNMKWAHQNMCNILSISGIIIPVLYPFPAQMYPFLERGVNGSHNYGIILSVYLWKKEKQTYPHLTKESEKVIRDQISFVLIFAPLNLKRQ